jgi:UDP-N-acetylmuramate dehydrogenase
MRIDSLAEKILMETNSEALLNEPMSQHTSLMIGGCADIFISPKGFTSLQRVINIAKDEKVDYHIIGNGTNILVSDEGIRGLVIQIKEGFGRMTMKKRDRFIVLKAEAGVRLSRVLKLTKELGFAGFEFAAGIPGTVGGAIMMNASTRLGAVSDILHSVEVLDKTGKVKKIKRDKLDFKYRQLNIESGAIILNGTFNLAYAEAEEVTKKIDDFLKEKRASQPSGESAGCIFKNPAEGSAGKIIDELGLKGKRVGGAYISNAHANFVMNDGTATCRDFLTLIKSIRQEVLERTGIELEYEIKFLGNM